MSMAVAVITQHDRWDLKCAQCDHHLQENYIANIMLVTTLVVIVVYDNLLEWLHW